MSRIVDTIRHEAPKSPRAQRAPQERRRRGSPDLGFVQYFHKGDRATVERTLDALDALSLRRLRTSISWCDWCSEGGEEWYAWLLSRLVERAEVLPCFLYTPPELGIMAKTSSPPREPHRYGEFVELVLRAYPGAFDYVELWNEPNNYIEWDWTIDPEWTIFAEMIAGAASRAAALGVRSVLGGMSPFDPNWLDLMYKRGALEHVDVIGVHGFPGTWEAVWDGWDTHVGRVEEVIALHGGGQRVWVTEAGYSTWSHDELGQLRTLVDLAQAPADRVYWYSVEDLAPERETLDGFHCDERAYHFGARRCGGAPKLLERVLRARGLDGVQELVTFASPRRPAPNGSVLITGGAGFVGTNLGDRLACAGVPVTILDSLTRPGVEENVRALKRKHGELVRVEVGDVRDVFAVRRAMASCARVFHLSAQVAVTTSLQAPTEDHDINVHGTINVLEEARRMAQPPAVVFTSTNKVYGGLGDLPLRLGADGYEPIDELTRARGISERQALDFCSPYGCSKGAADQYVLDYAHSYGLRTCVLRMSCVYGPHQHGTEDQGWVAHFLRQALSGKAITVYGDGHQVRDLLFVGDLVDALVAVSTHEEALQGKAFNVGGGPHNAHSVRAVAAMIGAILDAPPVLADGDWRTADQRYYVSDTSALQSVIGWSPRTSVPTGLADLYAWLRGSERPTMRPMVAAGGST